MRGAALTRLLAHSTVPTPRSETDEFQLIGVIDTCRALLDSRLHQRRNVTLFSDIWPASSEKYSANERSKICEKMSLVIV